MKKIFKHAFTLAETLITLTIIGIIAAMTIPTLLAKYQDHVTVTKLKKMQSVLANAVAMQRAKGDSINNNDIENYFILRAVKENLKGTNGQPLDFGDTSVDVFGLMILEDGIAVGTHTLYRDSGQVCVSFEKRGKWIGNKPVYFHDNPYSYCFFMTDNYALIPFGAPNDLKNRWTGEDIPELTREDTCPNVPVNDDASISGCTYWTLRTGKVTKKAGEWFDD